MGDSAYESINDRIEALVPSFLHGPVLSFKSTKSVQIKDPLLGICEKLMLTGILVLTVHLSFYGDDGQLKGIPDAYPKFSFQKGSFNILRNESFDSFPYCRDKAYEYFKPVRENGTLVKNYGIMGNDDKLACIQAMYADLVHKDAESASLMTFEKRIWGTTVACDVNRTCTPTTAKGTILNSNEPFVLKEDGHEKYSCTCLEMRNVFPVRPEGIMLEMVHSYQTPAAFNAITGGSQVPAEDYLSAPRTRVMNKHETAHRFNNPLTSSEWFEPGDEIAIEFDELIRLAFAHKFNRSADASPLDRPIDPNFVKLLPGALPPKRRSTGVTIDLEFRYDIRLKRKNGLKARPTCDILVSYTDGVVEWTGPVTIRKPRSLKFEESYDRSYTELQLRGVLVRFQATGIVSKWDPSTILAFVVSTLVFLPYVNTLIVIAGTMVSPRRHVYSSAATEKLDYDREMSKFAAQAMLIADAFRRWDQEGESKGQLTPQELKNVFKGADSKLIDDTTATHFVDQIFRKADHRRRRESQVTNISKNTQQQGDGTIDVRELVEIMSNDLCSFDSLRKHAEDEHKAEAKAKAKAHKKMKRLSLSKASSVRPGPQAFSVPVPSDGGTVAAIGPRVSLNSSPAESPATGLPPIVAPR